MIYPKGKNVLTALNNFLYHITITIGRQSIDVFNVHQKEKLYMELSIIWTNIKSNKMQYYISVFLILISKNWEIIGNQNKIDNVMIIHIFVMDAVLMHQILIDLSV